MAFQRVAFSIQSAPLVSTMWSWRVTSSVRRA